MWRSEASRAGRGISEHLPRKTKVKLGQQKLPLLDGSTWQGMWKEVKLRPKV